MWTWIRAELLYQRNYLLAIALSSVLLPLLLVLLLSFIEMSPVGLRWSFFYYLMIASTPWIFMFYASRMSLRHENRGILVLPNGVRRDEIAAARILLSIIPVPHLILVSGLMIWIGSAFGLVCSIAGVAVFLLSEINLTLYSITMDHYVDVSQQSMKVMLLMIPIFIPLTLVLNMVLFPSIRDLTPFLSSLGHPLYLFGSIGICLLECAWLFHLASSSRGLNPMLQRSASGDA